MNPEPSAIDLELSTHDGTASLLGTESSKNAYKIASMCWMVMIDD
jgi:hypothetical protein